MSDQRFGINLAVAVFALLEAASIPLLYFSLIGPYRLIDRSRTWVPVACTVIASEANEDGGYRHVFEYTVRGRTYRSTRATFWGAWAGFRYSDGGRVIGLVDPARPEEAVLRPNFRPPRLAWVAVALWLFVATWGLVSFLAIRLNVLPIATGEGTGRKRYYREL